MEVVGWGRVANGVEVEEMIGNWGRDDNGVWGLVGRKEGWKRVFRERVLGCREGRTRSGIGEGVLRVWGGWERSVRLLGHTHRKGGIEEGQFRVNK